MELITQSQDDFTIEYHCEYQPQEASDNEYPGCDESFEVIDIKISGDKKQALTYLDDEFGSENCTNEHINNHVYDLFVKEKTQNE